MSPKTVLMTGCSVGGIGAAVASALAKQSHYIFATARKVTKIPEELTALPNVTILALDISSPESLAEAVNVVATSGRQLDVLFNNAGAGYSMPVLDIDIEKAKQVYEINVWGTLHVIQAFNSLLIQSKGRIINMSTCGAAVNTPWICTLLTSYLSSKAALTKLLEILRLELSPFGVTVATGLGRVTVMAGVVDRKFHGNEPRFELPNRSLYAAIESIIAGWASGKSKPGGCTAEQFAEMIVPDIVDSSKGGMPWRGPHAGGIKFLSYWLPNYCQDLAMSMNQELKELTNAITSNSRQ
ncbi:oxidoreductase [Xylaria digitata]|nr:oxidoreductase [Xylaria digitata]